ncbi:hypothetical protein TNCV_2354271 [Trichonephila clavipes]|nr:hypothetical protein TNCV_2354271 [Trichonephila clavipes]
MLLLSSSSTGGLFLKVTIFRYPQRRKSEIEKSWERRGNDTIIEHNVVTPRYRSSLFSKYMNYVMMLMLMDGLSIGLFCKEISTSATFVFTMDAVPLAVPDCFLSATDNVSRNCCTKRVIADVFGAVSPGYFC